MSTELLDTRAAPTGDGTEVIDGLLRRVRRRLRLTWFVAVAQWLGPAIAVAALVVVALGFVRPWSWPEPAALVLAGGSVVAIALAALVVRITPAVAARAADRGLATHDAIATALELRGVGGPFAERVTARAQRLAAGRKGREAAALPFAPRRLVVTGVIGLVAVGAAFAPNHQDVVRARQRTERRALAVQATDLRATADQMARQPAAVSTAEALRALANTLERSSSLAAGQRAIDKTTDDLGKRVDPNLLAQKAAALGLERSTQAKPLGDSSAGQSASAQLAAAGASAAALGEAERQALAERLDQLAAAQQGANSELASALASAAASLRSGNASAAQSALSNAAAGQQARIDSIAGQQAAAAGAQAASNARSSLAQSAKAAGSGEGQGQGSGKGQGQGQGSGSGQGQGQGQGSGSGQGSGQGQGSGKGAGGAAGAVAGSTARTGNGQGGPGRVAGNGTGGPKGQSPVVEGTNIFDPAFTAGDQVLADPLAADGPGQIEGRTSGPNVATGAVTPLAEALPRYAAQATQALDTLAIPPSQRDLVKAYFDQLAERQK